MQAAFVHIACLSQAVMVMAGRVGRNVQISTCTLLHLRLMFPDSACYMTYKLPVS